MVQFAGPVCHTPSSLTAREVGPTEEPAGVVRHALVYRGGCDAPFVTTA